MKMSRSIVTGLGIGMLFAATAGFGQGPVERYVIKGHGGGDGEYLTWETAAPDIQSAIDAASVGDTVWVAPGEYDSGTKAGPDNTPNRVTINKAVKVISTAGPVATLIVGARDPEGLAGTGPAAVRGVYMADGAALIGFTVTNGATLNATGTQGRGAGIRAVGATAGIIISNCVVVANSAREYGGGININNGKIYRTTASANYARTRGPGGVYGFSSEFYDCTIHFNTNAASTGGGGVNGGTYHDSVIANNRAEYGGCGALSATLHRCSITNNTSSGYPGVNYNGAIADSVAYDCLIASNSVGTTANRQGGGAQNSTLYRCRLIGNYVGGSGGGAYDSTLIDCYLEGNVANFLGGGVSLSTVYNSVIVWNKSINRGGGAYNSTLYNTLIVGNEASYNVAGEAGGGAFGSYLANCTVVGNRRVGSANRTVGGISGGTAINSIVVGNECATYPNYGPSVVFTNSLTHPVQAGWEVGNITNAPLFRDWGSGYGLAHIPGDCRLQARSPGLNAGLEFDWMRTPEFAGDIRNLDLDGNPRIDRGNHRVDMGAYERMVAVGTLIMVQ